MKIRKQLGPIPEYPEEPNELKRFVLQAHFRGQSVHLDFRTALNDVAEGWTISAMKEDSIKVPVVTSRQAQEACEDQDVWKFDLESGLVFPRKVHTKVKGKERVVIRPGSLYAERKAQLIPKEWLDVAGRTGFPPDWPKTVLKYWSKWPEEVRHELRKEGFDASWAENVLQKGSWDVEEIPVGATRSFPGVFHILDQGTLTLGARKPYFFEYFPAKKKLLPERIAFRLVARVRSSVYRALLKDLGAIVLEPGVEEEAPRAAGYWVYTTPDPLPYVLSDEAIDKGWLPPKGVAALPYEVMKRATKEMRYWEMKDDDEREEAREKLAEWYSEGMKKAYVVEKARPRFKLYEQTYRGQIVIRFGPSTVLYWLCVDDPRLVLCLENSPILRKEAAGVEENHAYFDALWDKPDEFEPEPGTILNPTKATPSKVRLIDEGEAILLEEEPGFLRFKFSGKKLDGYYNILWEDPDTPFIVFQHAKEIETEKETAQAVLQLHSWKGGRHWDLRLEHEGKLLEFHFPEDPGIPPVGKAKFSECSDLSWLDIKEPSEKEGTFVEPLASWSLEWEEISSDRMRFSLDGVPYEARRYGEDWFLVPAQASLGKKEFTAKFASEEEQIVYGVVLSPFTDAHGDLIPAEEIRKAAHKFLAFGREIGLHHEGAPIEAYVVESYIAPQDLEYENGSKVYKGEWVLAAHIPEKELWDRVKRGDFTGFSIQGWGFREPLI